MIDGCHTNKTCKEKPWRSADVTIQLHCTHEHDYNNNDHLDSIDA